MPVPMPARPARRRAGPRVRVGPGLDRLVRGSGVRPRRRRSRAREGPAACAGRDRREPRGGVVGGPRRAGPPPRAPPARPPPPAPPPPAAAPRVDATTPSTPVPAGTRPAPPAWDPSKDLKIRLGPDGKPLAVVPAARDAAPAAAGNAVPPPLARPQDGNLVP